jgi:hypothetical protein
LGRRGAEAAMANATGGASHDEVKDNHDDNDSLHDTHSYGDEEDFHDCLQDLEHLWRCRWDFRKRRHSTSDALHKHLKEQHNALRVVESLKGLACQCSLLEEWCSQSYCWKEEALQSSH